jgi:hypothetical protein
MTRMTGMTRSKGGLSPEVQALLDRERQISVLPAAARTRMLSRARAALAAGVARQPIPSRAPSAVRWAAAAGLACVAAAAAGAASYSVGVRARPVAPPGVATPPAESFASHWSAGDELTVNLLHLPVANAKPIRTAGGSGRAELRLLEQARAAVAREDFMAALQLLIEHARRFRTGRLVEEREALRVKALAGLGRRGAARRAAADFEANFPRSPLLPSVSDMLDSSAASERN